MSERHSRLLPAVMLLAAAAGCQTPPSRVKTSEPPPAATAQVPVDASFDWHGLLIAPFGSVLKEVPAALHEVLLFRDDAHGAAPPEDAECYAADTPPPPFVGHVPDEYTLCFKRDRLSRIQATVRLPAPDAAAVFAAACTVWLKSEVAAGADACEGLDGAVHFSAHFEQEPETSLSITLDGAVDP